MKKENPLSWGLSSSLNIQITERPKNGGRVKKGLVGIIRLD
jgi:hypothetical protein